MHVQQYIECINFEATPPHGQCAIELPTRTLLEFIFASTRAYSITNTGCSSHTLFQYLGMFAECCFGLLSPVFTRKAQVAH
jgi:hypothetical protein